MDPGKAAFAAGVADRVSFDIAGASVPCCTPNAIASGQTALGTIASVEQFRKVAAEAGLTKFRRATETVFNRVFEARP